MADMLIDGGVLCTTWKTCLIEWDKAKIEKRYRTLKTIIVIVVICTVEIYSCKRIIIGDLMKLWILTIS